MPASCRRAPAARPARPGLGIANGQKPTLGGGRPFTIPCPFLRFWSPKAHFVRLPTSADASRAAARRLVGRAIHCAGCQARVASVCGAALLYAEIGIGGSLAAPPLPHHRAYG